MPHMMKNRPRLAAHSRLLPGKPTSSVSSQDAQVSNACDDNMVLHAGPKVESGKTRRSGWRLFGREWPTTRGRPHSAAPPPSEAEYSSAASTSLAKEVTKARLRAAW